MVRDSDVSEGSEGVLLRAYINAHIAQWQGHRARERESEEKKKECVTLEISNLNGMEFDRGNNESYI